MKKSVTKFSSGAIRDISTNKERYVETISWSAFKRYAQYMTSKREKYGSGNFKKGIPIESYEESLVRHIQKYLTIKYETTLTSKEISIMRRHFFAHKEKNKCQCKLCIKYAHLEPWEDHLSASSFNVFGIMHEEIRLGITKKTKQQKKV